MFDRFGKQHWWPGDSRFEIILGAILTQNTNWTNVEKAITNVKDADALCPEKLYRMDTETLAQLIKPAGYFNLKAGRLKNFLQWLFENYDGQVDALENLSAWDIREQLLGIKGIGPETADSIALYAYDKPVFVVDTYTCRIMVRHGLIEPEAGYEQVREFMEASLPSEIELFNEYHALLVQVGKEYCRPKPKCDGCPLKCLPHSLNPH
jgi:endonuclease-3 related protein